MTYADMFQGEETNLPSLYDLVRIADALFLAVPSDRQSRFDSHTEMLIPLSQNLDNSLQAFHCSKACDYDADPDAVESLEVVNLGYCSKRRLAQVLTACVMYDACEVVV